jgi:hypothetical protein
MQLNIILKYRQSVQLTRMRGIVYTTALIVNLVTLTTNANGQDLAAATKPAPGVQVFLVWSADTLAGSPVRYNLYRKLAAEAAYPSTPLNATPIAPMTNCAQFKTIIPEGSADWNQIANALADTTGGAPPVKPFSKVCLITSLPPSSPKWQIIRMLAGAKASVARVMGQAYQDNAVVAGTTYSYQLRRVRPDGTELPSVGANEVTITAGVPEPIPAPANVRLVIGDAKIQILWNKPAPRFGNFNVYRATSPGGPYRKINDVEISANIVLDIDSILVAPAANGFTDYERWDSLGNPMPRTVPDNPTPFSGPANGTTYWYKVAHKDILGQVGPRSDGVAGTPVDETPPAAPKNIMVDAIESSSSFRIRWTRVRHDVSGHAEGVAKYRIYRYAKAEHPDSGATFIPPAVLQPDSNLALSKEDHSSGLRSACRDSTLYFRVEAIDLAGNISRRSIAVGAALKDTTRPAEVKGTSAEGFDDFIRVRWQLNTDCNVAQYLIYRALCDYGKWFPCPDTSRKPVGTTTTHLPQHQKRDCGGPFALIGTLSQAQASARGNPTFFDDRTIPAGSPLCYAYVVKAQDRAQNISGTLPIPKVPPEIIVCERLRDRTPPEPGIITRLAARDSAIQVDYIGPPIQDIAAYHVYRSEKGEFDAYQWIGGMTVEPPPGVGSILTAPYVPPPLTGCEMIPLVSNPYMSAGTFIDRNVDRKRIYWYKVLGVDRNGNQSHPDTALAISTFTFAANREAPPVILSVAPLDTPCALTVTWTPAYDPAKMRGFFVFRSTVMNGSYYQLEGLQKTNAFVDNAVARNVIYWYRVVMLRHDGMLTNLSEPKNGIHP